MKKQWHTLSPDIDAVERLCRALQCHPAIATILVNRGIVASKDASDFLEPSLKQLGSPFSIKDMDTAVHRIATAIKRDEKILIFGDYDVDGVTATAILLDFFQYVGAKVSYYIPHRVKEGYGLQSRHIATVAIPNRINLIVTVDSGSGSYDAVKAANAAGIDIIITDHHIISETMPPAVAVVNPKRPDCSSGLDDLAGVGVAFYLLICLRKKLRDLNFWQDRIEPNLKSLCDLVALGTLADMVPLVAENRVLTRAGLDILHSNRRPGLNALLRTCGVKKHSFDADVMVFGLAPRLNAAGRMDHASVAVELLMTADNKSARQIANLLDKMNQKRRSIENEIFAQIKEQLNNRPNLLQKNILVFASQGWHLGVLGIVAARIVQKYFRPAVLITAIDGIGKGSARSIPGVDIYEGLLACADDLETLGGHSMAAGLKIKPEKIEQFQKKLDNAVGRMIEQADNVPKIYIDYELCFDDMSAPLIDEIESLKPFGTGNPEPLFLARNIDVVSSKIVGGNHRRMVLKQSSGRTGTKFNAIHFNIDSSISLKERYDLIAFRLRWNRWNKRKTGEIVIEATCPG
jgi:single-stranded-DNA-specific exonuclease